jgi:hypothetical protein
MQRICSATLLLGVAVSSAFGDVLGRGKANGLLEEPNALIAHVRVCGNPGRETARGHPVRNYRVFSIPLQRNFLAGKELTLSVAGGKMSPDSVKQKKGAQRKKIL